MLFLTTNGPHVPGLEVATTGSRGYSNGHRGIWMERGSDNLISNFNISVRMYHDISISYYEQSTALINGTAKDLNMDHHRRGPYANLWSNIDLGIGARPFASSGDASINGNHTSSFSTFWNVT